MSVLEKIATPPRTIMEVYKQLPEGTLAKLIDGVIYRSPSPITDHQQIIMDIGSEMHFLAKQSNLGRVFVAPFDVYLDEERNAVQPDIIFVAKANEHIIQDHIHGVPDLLIEVLSPSNSEHDTKVKRELYERFGVKEYWIIDPKTKEATGYFLEGDKFEKPQTSRQKFHSRILDTAFSF